MAAKIIELAIGWVRIMPCNIKNISINHFFLPFSSFLENVYVISYINLKNTNKKQKISKSGITHNKKENVNIFALVERSACEAKR